MRICSERMIGALDLLDGLLTLNPKHRLSASAALHQLYFKAEPRAAKPEECDTRRKHSHSPPVWVKHDDEHTCGEALAIRSTD